MNLRVSLTKLWTTTIKFLVQLQNEITMIAHKMLYLYEIVCKIDSLSSTTGL